VNPKNRTLVIVAGVVVLIVAAALIAVLATGGSDDSGDSSGSTDTSSEIQQTRPVDITGEALAPLDDPAADPAVGQVAPVITGAGFDGTPMTIGGATDNPTMLVFLAHWCPHCNREVPELIALNDAGGVPDDLNVIGISTAVASDRPNYPPSEWIVDKGWPWPTMADSENSEAVQAYGGTGFPFLVILDSDGTVLARQSGESTADELGAWIEATLATASANA
jgi:cytochrome c biogenesis protein CcmG/thiol:disulfide interchange protein DsbE